jgi:hypothetical protein
MTWYTLQDQNGVFWLIPSTSISFLVSAAGDGSKPIYAYVQDVGTFTITLADAQALVGGEFPAVTPVQYSPGLVIP